MKSPFSLSIPAKPGGWGPVPGTLSCPSAGRKYQASSSRAFRRGCSIRLPLGPSSLMGNQGKALSFLLDRPNANRILRYRRSPQSADFYGAARPLSGREDAQCRCGISPSVTALCQPSASKIDQSRTDVRVREKSAHGRLLFLSQFIFWGGAVIVLRGAFL